MVMRAFTEEERLEHNRQVWGALKHSTLFCDGNSENPRYFIARHKVDAETWEVVELTAGVRYGIGEGGGKLIHTKLDFGELLLIQILVL